MRTARNLRCGISKAYEGLTNAPIPRLIAFILAENEPKWDKRDFQGGPRGGSRAGGPSGGLPSRGCLRAHALSCISLYYNSSQHSQSDAVQIRNRSIKRKQASMWVVVGTTDRGAWSCWNFACPSEHFYMPRSAFGGGMHCAKVARPSELCFMSRSAPKKPTKR